MDDQAGGHSVIHPFLETRAFDPEAIRMIVAAFEDVLRELRLTDRNSPAVEVVAKRMIAFAQRGENDPANLRALVLKSIRDL
jgi:predicted ATPase